MLFYLLLAGGVVSGFTPVTYPTECGQYDPLQDQHLMETLNQVKQQLDANFQETDLAKTFNSYYQATTRPNGSLVQVYCDMEGDWQLSSNKQVGQKFSISTHHSLVLPALRDWSRMSLSLQSDHFRLHRFYFLCTWC